ncbi:hypothetical protein HA41_05945 [Pantoea conspicua]|uniref:YetF C-terminal domain-containing protein n=1 Tax=Pantoea conspicua TaxID=472705 RepID=A0A1X1BZA6_9GAMM|nr:YetF domain-containing protein [Pantoea conspicua]ORM54313.1 hypothetical protein HA41_05945 [Pantoea conspicua]
MGDLLLRWLMGEAPWTFAAEVLLRFLFIYLFLLLVMRLMGRRFAGQLSIIDLAIMIMLGAAIGAPLQTPEKGILTTIVLLITLLGCFRLLSWGAFYSHRLEVLTQGDATLLVMDGRLALEHLHHAEFSRDRTFSELRSMGIQHLGEVRRAWLEPSGRVSLLLYRKPRSGLWLLPAQNETFNQHIAVDGCFACGHCGYVVRSEQQPEQQCNYCAQQTWRQAVKRLGTENVYDPHQKAHPREAGE